MAGVMGESGGTPLPHWGSEATVFGRGNRVTRNPKNGVIGWAVAQVLDFGLFHDPHL